MRVSGRWIAVAFIVGTGLGLGLSYLHRRLRVPQPPALPEQSQPPQLPLLNDADRPPEVADLRIYHERDRPILQGTLAEIFPTGVAGLSDETKCLNVLRYVSSSVKLGPVDRYKTTGEYLQDRQASCGGFAMAFSDLVRSLGIPARYLGIFGFPQVGSHAIAEAYYDGAWHLYDATFGILFYSRSGYDGIGHVLSAKEILTAQERPTMMQVVTEPWRLNYATERNFGVKPVDAHPTWSVMNYWNEHNRRVAFPVAFGNESSVSFPVRVDLHERAEFRLGTPDRSWNDVYLASANNPLVGYFYFGGMTPTAFSTLAIDAPARSELEIVYLSRDEHPPPLALFPLDGLHLLDKRTEDRQTIFRAMLTADRGIGLVWCPKGLFWIDALTVRRIAPASVPAPDR